MYIQLEYKGFGSYGVAWFKIKEGLLDNKELDYIISENCPTGPFGIDVWNQIDSIPDGVEVIELKPPFTIREIRSKCCNARTKIAINGQHPLTAYLCDNCQKTGEGVGVKYTKD